MCYIVHFFFFFFQWFKKLLACYSRNGTAFIKIIFFSDIGNNIYFYFCRLDLVFADFILTKTMQASFPGRTISLNSFFR